MTFDMLALYTIVCCCVNIIGLHLEMYSVRVICQRDAIDLFELKQQQQQARPRLCGWLAGYFYRESSQRNWSQSQNGSRPENKPRTLPLVVDLLVFVVFSCCYSLTFKIIYNSIQRESGKGFADIVNLSSDPERSVPQQHVHIEKGTHIGQSIIKVFPLYVYVHLCHYLSL